MDNAVISTDQPFPSHETEKAESKVVNFPENLVTSEDDDLRSWSHLMQAPQPAVSFPTQPLFPFPDGDLKVFGLQPHQQISKIVELRSRDRLSRITTLT